MEAITSKQYFDKLQQDKQTKNVVESRLRGGDWKDYLSQKRAEYIKSIPEMRKQVKELNDKLADKKAQSVFKAIASEYISDLLENAHGEFGYYFKCQNFFEIVPGMILAIGEGQSFEEICDEVERACGGPVIDQDKHLRADLLMIYDRETAYQRS